MKKFMLALAVALVLCVPALADNEVYFAPSPFTFSNPSGNLNITATSADPSVPCYYFLRYSNSGNSQLRVFAITATEGGSANYSGVLSDGTSNTSSTSCHLVAGDYFVGGVDFVSGTDLQNLVTTDNLSIFPYNTDMSVIGSAFADYLANPPTPTPALSSSFTVPCGNVLYFQVSSEQDITLSAQMPQLSYLVQFGNNAYGPWGDTGIEYGPAAALPSSGTTFPILSMDPVKWAKGEPKNILGQSKVGVATKHCIVGQWYALFCPLTSPQVLDASTGDHAMGASVVVSGSFSQIKVYPLSETLDYDNPLGATYESGSNDGYDSYFDGSSDENGTVSWTNQDGQVQAPQSGGTNYVSPAANAESLLSQIRQLLANIVSELKSLFTFGYEAVQDLVGIMRDFVNVLGGLYTWLPAEVYSALMSAVVVAIVIGVFKVFL